MNCDPIARTYRWIEYSVFGRSLERCRTHFMSEAARCGDVLMIGEGDGRFLQSWLRASPDGNAVVVDASSRMLNLALERTRAGDRTRFIQGDVRTLAIPNRSYDLVVTHFLLDCLRENEVASLATRLRFVSRPNARWIVSDFALPHRPASRLLARALIRLMYQFFAIATGLEVRKLPDHHRVFTAHGMRLLKAQTSLGGLLVSELWAMSEAG